MSYPLVGTFPIFQPSYTLVAWRIGYDHGVVGVGGIRGALHASMIVTHALEDHVPGKRPDVTREMPVCDLSPQLTKPRTLQNKPQVLYNSRDMTVTISV